MKETIKAFLKNLFYCLFWKHTLGLNYLYTFLCVPFLFSVFQTFKKTKKNSWFWKSLFFEKLTFANFSSNFLIGINFRENRPKSQKPQKSLPARVSALKVDVHFRRTLWRFTLGVQFGLLLWMLTLDIWKFTFDFYFGRLLWTFTLKFHEGR